jgi:hypothetical protein
VYFREWAYHFRNFEKAGSSSGINIPSSLTINSSLCPFPKLNPSTTGFGSTITELVPKAVTVTVYFVGIIIEIYGLFYI